MEGNVDPVRDIEIIHEELRLKDEEMLAPILDKLEKTAVRGGDKKLKPEYVSVLVYVLCSCSLFFILVSLFWGLLDFIHDVTCRFLLQDIMLKVKNWIEDEKKHVRFYGDWNDKEVMMYVCVLGRYVWKCLL